MNDSRRKDFHPVSFSLHDSGSMDTLFSGEHIATGVPYVHRKTLLPVSVNGDITRLSGCLLMV